MIVSIHQPAYLPWLGYLERIVRSDLFIFLDIVQFEKNSFTNRNRIKTPQGSQWLTVPVLHKGHMAHTLEELLIDSRQPWARKHLTAIEHNYRKAPFFEQRHPHLVQLFADTPLRLTDLCFKQLEFWLKEFAIPTPVVRASSLNVEGSKAALVLALCQAVGADTYLSGPLGRDYLDPLLFEQAGVCLSFQQYQPISYTQLHGDFLPALSALDYWMNCSTTSFPGFLP